MESLFGPRWIALPRSLAEQRVLDGTVAHAVGPVTLSVAGLLVLFGALGALGLPPEPSLMVLDDVTVGLMVFAWALIWRGSSTDRHAHAALAGTFVLVIGDLLVWLAIERMAGKDLSGLFAYGSLILIMAGGLFLSWRWLGAVMLATTSVAAVAFALDRTLDVNMVSTYVVSVFVALGMHSLRMKNYLEASRLRSECDEARRLAAVGALVAGVSHEINNPLTYANGRVELTIADIEELLETPDLPACARERLQSDLEGQRIVLSGLERIGFIAKSLRQASRPRAIDVSIEDLSEVADTAFVAVKEHVPQCVRLVRDYRAKSKARMNSSEVLRVVEELVLNAADALSERSNGTITIRTRDENGRVLLEVQDDGPGISETDQAQIFTPFFTTKEQGKGVGLALSLAHQVVQGLGGNLTFLSEGGHGATFRVDLPAATG